MNEKIEYNKLPWHFEAFRSFINFDVLQQSATVLCLFEGKNIFKEPSTYSKFERTLVERTGIEWLPERKVSDDILFNVEGSLFRNKARVFTSFYLVDPTCIKKKENLVITPLCKALGTGVLTKKEFYKIIVSRYKYPHSAYDENWTSWKKADLEIKPLQFILKILYELHELDSSEASLNVSEFATYAHSNPFIIKAKEIALNILSSRKEGADNKRERSDQIDRKIGDIFGFLCITGYTYFYKNRLYINLMDVHPKEQVYYWEKRGDINRKEEIKKLVENE